MGQHKTYLEVGLHGGIYSLRSYLKREKIVELVRGDYEYMGFVEYEEATDGRFANIYQPFGSIEVMRSNLQWFKDNNIPKVLEIYDEIIIREDRIGGKTLRTHTNMDFYEGLQSAIDYLQEQKDERDKKVR